MARMVPAIERFNGSAGASFLSPGLRLEIDTAAGISSYDNATLTALSGSSLPKLRW
jgi:hypothetical protein